MGLGFAQIPLKCKVGLFGLSHGPYEKEVGRVGLFGWNKIEGEGWLELGPIVDSSGLWPVQPPNGLKERTRLEPLVDS